MYAIFNRILCMYLYVGILKIVSRHLFSKSETTDRCNNITKRNTAVTENTVCDICFSFRWILRKH